MPLKLKELPTHRRLLNAVGYPSHCGANPAMLRHIVKQLEMVDVHHPTLHRIKQSENARRFLFARLCVEMRCAPESV
jgi:homospermidine synthase